MYENDLFFDEGFVCKTLSQISKRIDDCLANLHMISQFEKTKFDTNNDASNECENERIFLNLLEFS